MRPLPLARPWCIALTLLALALCAWRPAMAQPEPAGKHPRILLDSELQKAWRAAAQIPRTPVARAVQRCAQVAASPAEFSRAGYMALDWAHHLQACLVAYAATGRDEHAATAMRYFTGMLDDLERLGDGKGGDEAARRDSGYAIRAMGPYTALAYDWLHDHKLMTEELRRRARQRFAAWTAWHLQRGYRARSPATNYQAGYLMAATLIAVAQANEAGAAGTKLWRHVVDELWRTDMTKAFAEGGVLDGGDWAEGWQYGPLSVAHYALTLRVMRRHGVELEAAKTWPVDLLRRHVYALTTDDRLFVGGDTQTEEAYIEPYVFGMAAIALSDAAPPDTRAHAVAEMDRLGLASPEFLLFDALARGVGVKGKPVPRESWPTWYVAKGTSTLYARTRWDQAAIWTVMQCSKTLDVDHFQPNAGNFVLSRGKDHLIVDPSPYGSLSTLTGNAPTVDSPNLPEEYRPSQAYWSERTGFRWAHQTQRGVVIARCDYADQYKIQDRPSDVRTAVRDFVLVPSSDGTTGALIVADRADPPAKDRKLHLRFRSPAAWKLRGSGATLHSGASELVLTAFDAAKTKPTLASPSLRDCFKDSVTRGNCDAARYPVVDYRVALEGPKARVTHVLEVGAKGKVGREAPVRISGTNFEGVAVAHERGQAVVVWATSPGGLVVPAKPGSAVIIHDAVPAGRSATLTGKKRGADCEVSVQVAQAAASAAALVAFIDEDCTPQLDAPATSANAPAQPPAVAEEPSPPRVAVTDAADAAPTRGVDEPAAAESEPTTTSAPRSPRSGCCGASATASSTLPAALLVLLALLTRRRRRR